MSDAAPTIKREPSEVAEHVAASSRDVAITVSNLGKCYKLYDDPWGRATEWVTRGRIRRHTPFWALRGVSFDVARGECLGVVGANGAGKSTLLKMLTGAIYSTEGSFEVKGRVLSLIELGTGVNQELTGRQNVFHTSRLLAFPPGYAKERVGAIEAFADIGAFFDRPVKLYSSGMKARLGFSMFVNMQPDVFIVDEVLSVGDVFFKQRCAARIREMLDGGMTMLFVSHDVGAIEHLCSQAIFLKEGRCEYLGAPDETITRYNADMQVSKGNRWSSAQKAEKAEKAREAPSVATAEEDAASDVERGNILPQEAERTGEGRVRLEAVRVTNARGRDALHATVGERLIFHLLLEARDHVTSPTAGVLLYDRFGTLIFGGGTGTLRHELPDMSPGDRVIVRLDVTMSMRAGQYSFHAGVSEPVERNVMQAVFQDLVTGLGPLKLQYPGDEERTFFGMAKLPMRAEHEVVARGAIG